MPHYTKLYERGDECADNRRAYVRLYANNCSEDSYTKAGTNITTAVENAMDQLYNWNAVSYYKIDRFNADASGQPYEHPEANENTLRDDFDNFLTDGSSSTGNGTGDNLKQNYIGAHTLVHGFDCNTSNAGAALVDCNDHNGTAFRRGAKAWTGATCSGDSSLAANSVIQEILHTFIRPQQTDVRNMICDASGNGSITHFDDHSLGRIKSDNDVTPYLTYHAAEFSDPCECECNNNASTATGYTENLTSCTKDAVKAIGNHQCSPSQNHVC